MDYSLPILQDTHGGNKLVKDTELEKSGGLNFYVMLFTG